MSKTIITAVDETDLDSFKKVIDSLDSDLCMLKIGSVSFNAFGHEAVFYASNKGFDIFLDLKLHDIPNTVKEATKSAGNIGADYLTIHVSSSKEALYEA